jgi:hypothetical protein
MQSIEAGIPKLCLGTRKATLILCVYRKIAPARAKARALKSPPKRRKKGKKGKKV